jgi:membrane protease YdiL (CAAX protease family)
MIAQDSLSRALTALAIFIVLYLSTFETSALILFPAFLLITGIVLQFYLLRKVEVVDSVVEEGGNIFIYTLMALAGIGLGGLISPTVARAVPVQKMELTGMDAVLYAVLMAVAEEQFFRGGITNFLLTMFPPPMAIMGSAAIFSVYHLAVYGTTISALAYVFIGGVMLAWVAYRSGRLSPSILAHVVNNILSFLVG